MFAAGEFVEHDLLKTLLLYMGIKALAIGTHFAKGGWHLITLTPSHIVAIQKVI